MAPSFDEAAARVTGPGQPYETARRRVGGVEVVAFTNAPGSLRDLLGVGDRRRDEVFIVHGDDHVTYGELLDRVDALAAALVGELGVRHGDRVAIAMRNLPEWVVAFAATCSIGAIAVPLNAWWTTDELAFALADATPKVLVVDQQRLDRTAGVVSGSTMTAVVVGGSGPPPRGVVAWADLVAAGAIGPPVAVDPDDDATILYTSGTTGRPKGAVSTHRALLQAVMGFGCRAAIEQVRNPPPSTPVAPAERAAVLLGVPLFHATGLVAVLLRSIAIGAKVVMMHRWDADEALRLIERHRITNVVGVPTQTWDLVNCPGIRGYDTSSLRSVGGGGAAAPPELVRRMAEAFPGVQPGIGYGMTETNAYGPHNAGNDYRTHPTSCGRGTPVMEVAIRDEDGTDLPVGAIGEIWFKGPHLVRGYWNRPADTRELLVDGWLRTGDLGRVDDDGFVYVLDRVKDMVLRGGENVYCAEVEAALYEHPDVLEAAVFGLPDERLGETVAAVVRLRGGAGATADQLRAAVGERLAAYKVPDRIDLWPSSLPRNAAGKFLKRELRGAVLGSRA